MIWLPPFLTVFLFASSAICGRRLTMMMDSMWANWVRLGLAASFLCVIAMLTGGLKLSSPAFPWYFLSGIVGFGLGDMALFLAYARLGSRLTLVLNLCLAPLFAAAGEMTILETTIAGSQFVAMGVVLLGVIIAVSDRRSTADQVIGSRAEGFFWAIVAGLGQGCGGVISRWAVLYAEGQTIAPFCQAFQRCLGGLSWVTITTLACYPMLLRTGRRVFDQSPDWLRLGPWMLGAALFGPVVGVACFQWSLVKVENAAYVQAVISTTPIAIIPLAWFFERDRPTSRSIFGAVIAIGGVIAICLLRR